MSDAVIRVQITLQTNATEDAALRQIRSLLKLALRRYGLQCVDIAVFHGSSNRRGIFTIAPETGPDFVKLR